MIEKTCKNCKASKPLGEFFSQPQDARANSVGTSAFCKQCHDDGKIEHGYGWYGNRYKSPDYVLQGLIFLAQIVRHGLYWPHDPE